MRRICILMLGMLLAGWLAATVQAETFELADGTSVTGEIILPGTGDGLNFRISQSKYQRVPWDKFSQESLLELAKNPKLVTFVEPLIEPPEEERAKKTEIVIKRVDRLERPAVDPLLLELLEQAIQKFKDQEGRFPKDLNELIEKHYMDKLPKASVGAKIDYDAASGSVKAVKSSLFGALFGTAIGIMTLVLIYAGNIYSAYEISVVKAQSPLLVCGVSAVLPVIGQIIFLCMPTRVEKAEEKNAEQAAAREAATAQMQAKIGASAEAAGIQIAKQPAVNEESTIPETQVFARGKTTFNRRFFETKFAGFFGVIRREAEKELMLTVKTARGEYLVQRISRITGNEMHLEVRKGGATQEVTVPFTEVTEVQLKHKDAA